MKKIKPWFKFSKEWIDALDDASEDCKKLVWAIVFINKKIDETLLVKGAYTLNIVCPEKDLKSIIRRFADQEASGLGTILYLADDPSAESFVMVKDPHYMNNETIKTIMQEPAIGERFWKEVGKPARFNFIMWQNWGPLCKTVLWYVIRGIVVGVGTYLFVLWQKGSNTLSEIPSRSDIANIGNRQEIDVTNYWQ